MMVPQVTCPRRRSNLMGLVFAAERGVLRVIQEVPGYNSPVDEVLGAKASSFRSHFDSFLSFQLSEVPAKRFVPDPLWRS